MAGEKDPLCLSCSGTKSYMLLPPQGEKSLECPLRFFIIERHRSWSKRGRS